MDFGDATPVSRSSVATFRNLRPAPNAQWNQKRICAFWDRVKVATTQIDTIVHEKIGFMVFKWLRIELHERQVVFTSQRQLSHPMFKALLRTAFENTLERVRASRTILSPKFNENLFKWKPVFDEAQIQAYIYSQHRHSYVLHRINLLVSICNKLLEFADLSQEECRLDLSDTAIKATLQNMGSQHTHTEGSRFPVEWVHWASRAPEGRETTMRTAENQGSPGNAPEYDLIGAAERFVQDWMAHRPLLPSPDIAI